MAHFNCPECGAPLEYPEHVAGSMVRCRSCRQFVPLQSSATEPTTGIAAVTPSASPDPLVSAHELMKSCRFAEAADLLAAAPRERRQPQLTSLLMHVQYLRGLREAAHESLTRPGDATADVERYLRALQAENLRDTELELQIHRIRQAANPRGRGLGLLLAFAAALALLIAVWQAFFGEPADSEPAIPDAGRSQPATTPASAGDRFAAALGALRAGNRSEAAASWASALAVSNGDESADTLADYLDQEKSRLAQLSPAERRSAAEELQQLDKLAASGSDTLRIRLVRSELLQLAADLLIADQDPAQALELLQTAAELVPDSPRTQQLSSIAISGMITLGAAGDPRFPAEIVIPVIDRANAGGLSAADAGRLRALFAASQRESLEAFLEAPLLAPLLPALDAFQGVTTEGDLPQGFADTAAFSAAFDAALAARIRGDLEAGRLADALQGLQRLRQIHGTLPDVVLDSLRMCPRTHLEQLPDELRSGLLVRTSTIGQRFQLIEAGQFEDGAGTALRTVTLTRWHYLAETELTRGQYKAVTGFLSDVPPSDDSRTTALPDTRPILLTWDQAQEFCRILNDRPEEQQRGQSYRLATEAEWEFAGRSGGSGPWCFGQQPELLDQHAWSAQNSGGNLQDVGRLLPSRWGIFDQHGNAEEWVQDWFAPLSSGLQADPRGPESGTLRVVRGGSWLSGPAGVTVQARGGLDPATGRCGVRLVQQLNAARPLQPPNSPEIRRKLP